MIMNNLFYSKKTSLYILYSVLIALMINTGCSSDNDDQTFYPLKVSTDKNWVDAKESNVVLTIESESSVSWEIIIQDTDKSWVSIDKSNGVGNATLNITLAENKEKKERFLKFVVSNGDEQKPVYITQAASKGEAPNINNAEWMELPAKSSLANTILVGHNLPDNDRMRNYSMLYDTINRIAYWVAYPMHSSYLGSASRTDDWQYDPSIKKQFQPQLFKGFGVSGIDRGHQLPSADRTVNSAANKTTFYFSNMTAQNSTLNQGIWADLEARVRVWTKQCDTLYVVSGAMIKSSNNSVIEYVKDNGGLSVAKPQYYYKALAKKMGNTYYTIAYKMDNKAPSSSTYNTYKLTISQLEKETGFTFFPKLSSNDKSKIVEDQWK